MPTIQVDEDDYRRLLNERDALNKQVSALMDASSKALETGLPRTVRAFHLKFGHPVAITPAVPEEEQVRFRMALIAEEFKELFASVFTTEGTDKTHWRRVALTMSNALDEIIKYAPVVVDLPELADAMGDLDYVVEGTRAVFGINGHPIAVEIHRANMSKDAVYVEAKDDFKRGQRIKPVKPDGWRPPDVAGVLRSQGWDGSDGRCVRSSDVG